MVTGVAAGHEATLAAGIEVLRAGGTAADAAVAACLASCVAETVMTGLLGGGHALYYESNGGAVTTLDCFVAAPSGQGARLVELSVPFGEELVHYAIGVSSCGVPGLPAGLDELWRRYGRLPWPRLVEPALRLARDGVTMPPAHAACLAMLAPVMTMREGGRIYAPQGRLLQAGDSLRAAGARDGARARRRGRSTQRLRGHARRVPARADGRARRLRHARRPRCVRGALGRARRDRLRAARPRARRATAFQSPLDVLQELPPLRDASPGERALALATSLDTTDRVGTRPT